MVDWSRYNSTARTPRLRHDVRLIVNGSHNPSSNDIISLEITIIEGICTLGLHRDDLSQKTLVRTRRSAIPDLSSGGSLRGPEQPPRAMAAAKITVENSEEKCMMTTIDPLQISLLRKSGSPEDGNITSLTIQ